ncbi:hypothetical protein QF037_000391 [Streptomyces canus]|nr:hypothetical protein [Streptomyces canus]
MVYSALLRDFFFDLKRGYFARLPKRLVNATCKCRSACWSGTDDTSPRYASSSVFFHAVSIAEVWLSLIRSCHVHARVRASSAML